jgi:uncharacterized coiled-coil protein SlyX
MTDELPPPQHLEEPLHLLRPRRRRWPLVLLFLVSLGLAGAGGAYAWANIGQLVQSLARGPSNGGDSGGQSTMPDLLATQQKTSEDLETLSRTVTDQRDQLKAVMDQLAALAAKVDTLQRPAPAPPPTPPIVAPAPSPQMIAPSPPPASAPVAQAVAKPRKPRAARTPKPAGPISTGGAPLPPSPDTGAR